MLHDSALYKLTTNTDTAKMSPPSRTWLWPRDTSRPDDGVLASGKNCPVLVFGLKSQILISLAIQNKTKRCK